MDRLVVDRLCWKPTLARHRGGAGGQSLIDYALILSLIAFVVIGVVTAVGKASRADYCKGSMALPGTAIEGGQCEVVWGQEGSFTDAIDNNGGVSASSLTGAWDIEVDSAGNMYVADAGNHRVLYYPAGSATATRVYGQGGSFTTNTPNNGGISANSLQAPSDVLLDSAGGLYVSEWTNNRVLYYPAGSTTATRVYGQGGNFTTNTANNGGITANSLSGPMGLELDGAGNLYVGDFWNNRVLFYLAGSTTATRVYGQAGSFTAAACTATADGLCGVVGPALDASGNLYIADGGNSRVLFYLAGSTTATRVYGQGGIFTTGTQNNGGISANSMWGPQRVVIDGGNNIYVDEYSNNRVLFFPAGSTTATRVYGQGGSFSSNTQNNGGVSAKSLFHPRGLRVDDHGNLFVADNGNHRVLEFTAG